MKKITFERNISIMQILSGFKGSNLLEFTIPKENHEFGKADLKT
jgi:hypothetical protein